MFCLRYYSRTVSTKLSFHRIYAMDINRMIVYKSRAIATELMKKRQDDKRERKNNLVNGADLHIIGSNSQGFRPSVILTTEGNSYLFNCAEGFQRLCYSSKIKLSHLRHLFITNLSWDCVPGSYGLSLTLQDAGSPEFTIHGPDGIENFFDSTRTFMSFTTGIKCRTEIQNFIGDYIDPQIHISPIVIDESNLTAKQDNNPSQMISKKIRKSPKLLAYICSLPDLPGQLNPQKCRELKVPVGPLLGQLKSGCDITLPNGNVVRSVDVCGPKQLGARILMLECPTIQDIDLVTNNAKLNELRQFRATNDLDQVNYIVHFSPDEVTNHPRFLDWMDGFPQQCKHFLILHNEPTRANFIDTYRLQYLLRKLDDQLFPDLWLPESLSKAIKNEIAENSKMRTNLEYATEPEETEIKIISKGDLSEMDNIIRVASLDRYYIRPNRRVEAVDAKTSMDALYQNAWTEPNFEESLQEYRELQDKSFKPREHEPEIVFLGTGSALPSKLRNTSCIVINFQAPHNCSIIMDCGEDSYGQIYRLYGPEKTKDFLRRLKLVYVSHHHQDHHGGLIQILRHRKEVTDEPLALLIPPGVELLLNYHNENYEDLSLHYDIFDTKRLKTAPTLTGYNSESIPVMKADIRDRTGGLIDDFTIVGVDHCINSCAVVMKFKIGQRSMDTFRVAYSGDARPSRDFIEAGKNCDLLIHEATFDHRSELDAVEKKHCTSTEAIRVSKMMEAKFTILTHFSQRMPKIPYLDQHFDDKIGFAFDNMAIRCPSHFPRLPIMKKIMSLVFAKSLNEIEEKYMKQTLKQQSAQKMLRTNMYSQQQR